MNDLRGDYWRGASLGKSIARRLGRMLGSWRGGVEKDINVIALSQRVERGGQDLMLEPEPSEDQDRPIYCGERLDKAFVRPWRTVFLENELSKRQCARPPCGGRLFLLQSVPCQYEHRDIHDIGRIGEGGNRALMSSADARVNRGKIRRVGRDEDEGADRGIHERRIADLALFHFVLPQKIHRCAAWNDAIFKKVPGGDDGAKWFTLRERARARLQQ